MEFSQSLASIQRYRDGLTLRYVVPTFIDRRVRKSEEILDQLQTYFPDRRASQFATTCASPKPPATASTSSSMRPTRPAPRTTGDW